LQSVVYPQENGQMHLKKNNTFVAKDSCEKDHSNYQSKDFGESGESKDVSKSHAECNVTHFSGDNVVNQLRTVAKKAIQTKKVYILMKRKWHDDYKRRNSGPISFSALPVLYNCIW